MIGSFSYNYNIAHTLLSQAKEHMCSQNELPKAKMLLENSLEIFPNYVEAHYYLAVIYERINDFSQAEEEYNKAVIINPFYAKAFYRMAILNEEFYQDYESARKNFEKAIDIKSNYFDACYRLANLFEKQYFDYDKAVHYYTSAHKLKPENTTVTFRLANIHQEHLLDYTGAKKYYLRTIETEPGHAMAHYYLSFVLARKLNDKAEGRKHYLIASDLNKSLKTEESDHYFGVNRNFNSRITFNSFIQLISTILFFTRFRVF